MEKTAVTGSNRTGIATSPKHTGEMLDSTAEGGMTPGTVQAMQELRASFLADAEQVGSVPPPTSLKGALKSGVKILTGKNPQAFIDKLAERLAFERGGTRLYEALIVKHQARSADIPAEVQAGKLREIRDQEAAHFHLLVECLRELGADPTAVTPCADVVGVQTFGLLQVITDPRTTFLQSLSSALAAELIDVAGWDLLMAMAEREGHIDMANRFKEALRHETDHLDTVQHWYELMTMAEGDSAVQAAPH